MRSRAKRVPSRTSYPVCIWLGVGLLSFAACDAGSGGDIGPTDPSCNIPFSQEQALADNQVQLAFGTSINACLGHPSCDDIGAALRTISDVSGIHGKFFVFDGGAAEGFGAWTFPANTLVFHVDTWRCAIATASLYEAYLIGIPIPGFGIPTGEINGFRAALDAITNEIANTFVGPEPLRWTTSTPEGTSFGRGFLCGVTAHEISHVKNGDAVDRICTTIKTGNPYLVAAFSFLQERQADIDGANFVADAYLRDPNGPANPIGMLLLMEMLSSAERLFGAPATYPRAEERLSNVRQVFKSRGVPDSLFFYQ